MDMTPSAADPTAAVPSRACPSCGVEMTVSTTSTAWEEFEDKSVTEGRVRHPGLGPVYTRLTIVTYKCPACGVEKPAEPAH